jgi:hypothetical protein
MDATSVVVKEAALSRLVKKGALSRVVKTDALYPLAKGTQCPSFSRFANDNVLCDWNLYFYSVNVGVNGGHKFRCERSCTFPTRVKGWTFPTREKGCTIPTREKGCSVRPFLASRMIIYLQHSKTMRISQVDDARSHIFKRVIYIFQTRESTPNKSKSGSLDHPN